MPIPMLVPSTACMGGHGTIVQQTRLHKIWEICVARNSSVQSALAGVGWVLHDSYTAFTGASTYIHLA